MFQASKYCQYEVAFANSTLFVIGHYTEHPKHITFHVVLKYGDQSILYKSWDHKKFAHIDEFPTSDPKVERIAKSFDRMDEATFKHRFQTLLLIKPKV